MSQQRAQAHAITQSDENQTPYLRHVGVHNLGRCMCQYIPVCWGTVVRVFNCCPLSNVFIASLDRSLPFFGPGPTGHLLLSAPAL
jgi:hypothetical protein